MTEIEVSTPLFLNRNIVRYRLVKLFLPSWRISLFLATPHHGAFWVKTRKTLCQLRDFGHLEKKTVSRQHQQRIKSFLLQKETVVWLVEEVVCWTTIQCIYHRSLKFQLCEVGVCFYLECSTKHGCRWLFWWLSPTSGLCWRLWTTPVQ